MHVMSPRLVVEAEGLARAHGFGASCTPAVGALLRTMATTAGRVLELGTGFGVGTAWLTSGLRPEASLVTIEHEPLYIEKVGTLFAADPRVMVLEGDWKEALKLGPFDLVFVDVAEAKDVGSNEVVSATSVGGLLVLDDFTPGPTYRGQPDVRWGRWMNDQRLSTCEVLIDADSAVILAARSS